MVVSEKTRELFEREHGYSLSEGALRCCCDSLGHDPQGVVIGYEGQTRREIDAEIMALADRIAKPTYVPDRG